MINTILVIDNDVPFLVSLLPLLENELKLKTIIAKNGKEGLLIFDKKPVSLILLDLNLPDICGLDVLKSIRGKCSQTKVFIVTGRSSHEYAAASADLRVDGYLQKPLHPSIVIDRLKKHIDPLNASHFKHFLGDGYEDRLASLSNTVKKALEYIQQNIDHNFQRDDVASYAHVSADYLSRIFHKECGMKFMDYVALYRIQTAKELLLSRPDLKVKNIARMVGMADVNHFSRLFKKKTSMTPVEFREKRLL